MDGPSARISALVVLVALGVVVGLAVAGRKPVAPVAPVVIEAGTLQPTPAPTLAPTAAPGALRELFYIPFDLPPAPAPTGRVMVIWDETVTLAPGATPNWDAPAVKLVFKWLGKSWMGPGQKLTR